MSNFPEEWSVMDVKEFLGKFGNVVDCFMPRKRNLVVSRAKICFRQIRPKCKCEGYCGDSKRDLDWKHQGTGEPD